MLAYKGFHSDLTCTLGKGVYQYQEGVWIEELKANCARNGFHCAENPIDCLTYYPEWDRSAYYLVEAGGDIDEDGSDSRISCTRIKLLRPLDIYEFVVSSVEYICRHPEREIGLISTGKIRAAKNEGRAAAGGAIIVYGEAPRAIGPEGSVLALIKIKDKVIESVCVRKIDGEKYKADTWYKI